MKISFLCIALALALLGAAPAFAQSPQPSPQPQTLEQLRLAIFQAGPSAGAADPVQALSPDPRPASHCTGDFCTKLLCECAEQCQPCGIARFNCLALLCACRQC